MNTNLSRSAGRVGANLSLYLQQIQHFCEEFFGEGEGSPFAIQPFLPERLLREFTREIVEQVGIRGLHLELRRSLRIPRASWNGTGFPWEPPRDLQAVHALQAVFLGIIQRYGFRQYFHHVVSFAYATDDFECEAIAQYLGALAGKEKACATLIRKLRTPNERLREYLLFLISSFQIYPFFEQAKKLLYQYYLRESRPLLKETYEYLFSF